LPRPPLGNASIKSPRGRPHHDHHNSIYAKKLPQMDGFQSGDTYRFGQKNGTEGNKRKDRYESDVPFNSTHPRHYNIAFLSQKSGEYNRYIIAKRKGVGLQGRGNFWGLIWFPSPPALHLD
jgi:hypothetical protein